MRIVGYEWMCKSSTRIYLGPLDFHSAAGMPTRIPFFPSRQKKQQQPKNKNWKTYSGRISKQHELSRFVKTRRLHHYIPIILHRSPSFAVSPISGEYPTLFAQHWLFPRYLTENFALRHLIEAYETQLAEKRHRFFRSPVRINELWWHYQPVICSIWGFP